AGHTDSVTGLAGVPGSDRCVTASHDGTVRVWDLQAAKLQRSLVGHIDRARCVAVSPDGRRALSGGCDGALLLWDLGTGRLLGRLVQQKHWIVSVAYAPDGRTALFGSLDGSLRPIDARGPAGFLKRLLSGGQGRRFQGHTQSVASVKVDASGRLAVPG